MFLVIEKKLCKVPFCEAPLALLCAFYVFNLHYTDGCTNFYTLFEVLFLGKKVPPKKTKLAAFLGQIKGMDWHVLSIHWSLQIYMPYNAQVINFAVILDS